MSALQRWMRQPTTVAGFSALLGTLCALLLHQMMPSQAVPLLVGSLTSMLLPDNAGARREAESLAGDLLAKFSPPAKL